MKWLVRLILVVAVVCVCVVVQPASAENAAGGRFGPSSVGGKTYEGEPITADLPLSQMFWNIGSKVDGAGLCVTTSIEQAARYQGIEAFRGFRDYCANFGGGAYPSKIDAQVLEWAKKKGLSESPHYLQYEGSDPGPLMELIDRTGRIACIAYGYSPRYGGPAINHMVFSPKPGSGKYATIVDNNQIGGVTGAEGSRYEWMERAELISRMKTQADRFGRPVTSNAWVFVWLEPPPPPPPFN